VSAADAVRVERDGAILEVILDRPKANAIDGATSRRMGEVFAAFRDDPLLRVAILTGAGERFFSAGWDLKSIAADGEPDWDMGVGGFGGLQELPQLNKPVIAAVNGMAIGGGFEVAMSADLIVAAEHAQFALPEIKAGILADAATIKLHRRIPFHLAMDLLMTGRWIDAGEAHRVGLVRDVVPAAELLDHARSLARMLADGPPLVLAAIKEVTRETAHLPIADVFGILERRELETVERLYTSEDMLEGARAFAEKREPRWQGR
jgi:crotonobetainyl-CoA hydratase